MIKFAYGSVPKDAGTFTFFRQLRDGLREQGVEMLCVSVGKKQSDATEKAFVTDGCVMLDGSSTDRFENAKSFAEWCKGTGVDVVMPVNSVPFLDALPHLDEHIRVFARCADSLDFGYRRATTCMERVSRIACSSPKQFSDLSKHYRIPEEKLVLIPHGIDSKYSDFPREINTGIGIRLAYCGRLEHNQKGVMFLPRIIKVLRQRGVDFQLSIAGEGPHREPLERALRKEVESQDVIFMGRLSREELPQFLASSDVLVFPSLHEGFGFSIIEAMMAGVVPIASRLKGVTDAIVADGQSGYLCDIGDVQAFAKRIDDLARQPSVLAKMSEAARSSCRENFSSKRMVETYGSVIRCIVEGPSTGFAALNWNMFEPSVAASRRRRSIPIPALKSLKRRVNRVIFYMGYSNTYE